MGVVELVNVSGMPKRFSSAEIDNLTWPIKSSRLSVEQTDIIRGRSWMDMLSDTRLSPRKMNSSIDQEGLATTFRWAMPPKLSKSAVKQVDGRL